jgi:hypothetical protein
MQLERRGGVATSWQHPSRPIRPDRPDPRTMWTFWRALDGYDRRDTRLRAWSGITGWRFESSSAHLKAPQTGAFLFAGCRLRRSARVRGNFVRRRASSRTRSPSTSSLLRETSGSMLPPGERPAHGGMSLAMSRSPNGSGPGAGPWRTSAIRSGDSTTWSVSDALADELRRLGREVERRDRLYAAGIPRRQRVLLHGPPGCGNSSAAEAARPGRRRRARARPSSFGSSSVTSRRGAHSCCGGRGCPGHSDA